MLDAYVKRILQASVYDVASETPLSRARNLSSRLGRDVWLKREDMQPIFSFKLRGAYNKIASLDEETAARGVITASAGNHGQGVALAANRRNIRATVVMGRNTPAIKVDAVRRLGATAVLHGDGYDDASSHAKALCDEKGFAFIPPYDDPLVIAGQGTIGRELVSQHGRPFDQIFVPVGGGGLIAGIAAYVKYLHPTTRIIGVEADGSHCLRAAFDRGRRVTLPKKSLDLFADGVSVAQIGKEPFKIARRYVDDVIVANVDEICGAIKDIFDDTRAIAEPAGALAVAGMKKALARESGSPGAGSVVAIVSGANVNFDRLRHVSERAEIGEQREAVFAVAIPEKPGSFRRLCRLLGRRNLTEFNYRASDRERANVFLGVHISGEDDREALAGILRDAGFEVIDLTDNEATKLHVRHMIGGGGEWIGAESLYRVEFPERPGALYEFLSGIRRRWSISLFHYRNHGSAWGRVFVGFAVDSTERADLEADLDAIGYRYWDENDNPAYEVFLR